MQPVPGYRFANWELGYGDFHLIPDLATLRLTTWQPKTAFVHCDVDQVAVAPRSILKKQIAAAATLGYSAMAASELEYFAYRESYRMPPTNRTIKSSIPSAGTSKTTTCCKAAAMEFYTAAVRRHLRQSGIPVENSKGEWGLGQHEVNVRYSDILTMADNHVLLKQCLKEIAEQTGISVTFMAKPHHGQAGSSCHIHLSLRRTPATPLTATRRSSAGSSEAGWRTPRSSWSSTPPPSTPISATKTCPGRPPASPGRKRQPHRRLPRRWRR
jgi:glutamine synthetase